MNALLVYCGLSQSLWGKNILIVNRILNEFYIAKHNQFHITDEKKESPT